MSASYKQTNMNQVEIRRSGLQADTFTEPFDWLWFRERNVWLVVSVQPAAQIHLTETVIRDSAAEFRWLKSDWSLVHIQTASPSESTPAGFSQVFERTPWSAKTTWINKVTSRWVSLHWYWGEMNFYHFNTLTGMISCYQYRLIISSSHSISVNWLRLDSVFFCFLTQNIIYSLRICSRHWTHHKNRKYRGAVSSGPRPQITWIFSRQK